MLNDITAIIFDLGGVVIDLDVDESLKMFSEYSGVSNDIILEKFAKGNWAFKFEKGEISSEKFREKVRSSLNPSLTDKQIDDAWNAMLRDLPKERLEMIGNLSNRYKTFVLSNTNDIHIQKFNSIVDKSTGGKSIDQYFNKVYYSHVVGMRKPDLEVFKYVVNENNLDPAKTLFIDDMKVNIEGAQSIGLKTLHLTNQDYLFELFA
jgi:putative hydrolase of the HAD superfamily